MNQVTMIPYFKLVRDGIIEHLKANGVPHTSHQASPEEFEHKPKEKLQEEVDEFFKARERKSRITELIDIQEVVFLLVELEGLSKKEFERLRIQKLKEKGGFKKRLILDEAAAKDDPK